MSGAGHDALHEHTLESEPVFEGARRALLAMAEIQFAAGARTVLPVHEAAREYRSWGEARAAIAALQPEWVIGVGGYAMKRIQAALGAAAAFGQTSVGTHAELQAVKADGSSDWTETLPFTIQGVILNDPEEMLDPAFNPEATGVPNGGQFQLFIQAVAAGDRGGTALFMSQMSYVPGNNYDEAAWNNEMQRVGYDGTGRKFRKGDRVLHKKFGTGTVIEAVGGELNASTSVEMTNYYARVLKDDLPLAMDILSDIMVNSVVDEDELARVRFKPTGTGYRLVGEDSEGRES